MAANNFTGAVNATWGTLGNWSLAAVPTAGDGNVATFTALSPACTVDSSARVCNAIDFTNYANTITMTNTITVSGDITLGSGMTFAGASALISATAGNRTSNGKTVNIPLTLTGGVTHTFLDNWAVSGLLTLGSGASNTVLNGLFTISASGSLTVGTSSGSVSGTTSIALTGTGTLTGPTGAGALKNNLTINTAGTITGASGTFGYNTGTFTYTGGTVNFSALALSCILSTTFSGFTSAATWNGMTFSGATQTFTLTGSDLCSSALVTVGSGTQSDTFTGGTVTISGGGLRHGGSTGIISGTTVFRITNTATLDAPSLTAGKISNPITLNAPGSTITISDPFACDLGQVLLTAAGSVVTTAGTWTLGSGSGGMKVHPGMDGGARG